MASGSVCLKHDRRWRCKLQEFLNRISGPSRRNPLICESDVKRITKAVCTCTDRPNPGPMQEWRGVTQKQFQYAHSQYTLSAIFKTSTDGRNRSLHQEFYENLKQKGAFTGHGTSADRLVYILCQKIKPPGEIRDTTILDEISPMPVRAAGGVVHLGSLKRQHMGRFIGRGGTGIREAVHGIPVGNITVTFDDNQDPRSDTVQVSATYSCRPRHIEQVRNGLVTRLGYYQSERPVPLRFRQPLGRQRQGYGPYVHPPMQF